VDVKISWNTQRSDKEEVSRVAIENAGRNLAFFVRLKVTKGKGGEEILPVIRQDNYFSLMPGEKRKVTATYDSTSLQGATSALEVGGWNVKSDLHQGKPPPLAARLEKALPLRRGKGNWVLPRRGRSK